KDMRKSSKTFTRIFLAMLPPKSTSAGRPFAGARHVLASPNLPAHPCRVKSASGYGHGAPETDTSSETLRAFPYPDWDCPSAPCVFRPVPEPCFPAEDSPASHPG